MSELEELFLSLWHILAPDCPEPKRGVPLINGRKFKCDFYWPGQKCVVEVDGGQFSSYGGGRHNTDLDRFKHNELTALGYRVFHVSGRMLKDDPDTFIGQVKRALLEHVKRSIS